MMTAKQYLMQINDMKKRIKEKRFQIESLRESLVSTSANIDGNRVQSSGSHDKIGSGMAKIVDRERELESYIIRFLEVEREISGQIDGLNVSIYREVLHWRYVCGFTFEKTAVAMDYSYKQTTRIHGKALLEFTRVYGELFEKMS